MRLLLRTCRRWMILTSLGLAGAVWAVDAPSKSSRYDLIPQRNSFGIKPPPAPEPPPPPPPPSTTVKLTGISAFLGIKRVVLQIQEQGKQPESKVLAEGQSSGPVEVLTIDPENRAVNIKNGDREVSLNMEQDGVKPPTTPVPPPGGAAPSMPAGVAPPPGGMPFPGQGNPGQPPGGMEGQPGMVPRPLRPPSMDRPYMQLNTNGPAGLLPSPPTRAMP